jgi:hypothetical protein
MKTQFVYKDRKTGKKIYSDKPLKGDQYILVMQVRNEKIKAKKVIRK